MFVCDVYILWHFALLYDNNLTVLPKDWIMLFVKDGISKCAVIGEISLYKWGWCVWKDVEWAESTYSVCCCVG